MGMGTDQSVKNLVTRTLTNVWNALIGKRPESYQIPEVGLALIEKVDHALFERKLEFEGDLKKAGDILDRVEVRMKKHDMNSELRILYADRARIAQRPDIVRRIARKAYDLEELPSVRAVIKTVLEGPTRDNLIAWRNSLDAYVPPFPAAM